MKATIIIAMPLLLAACGAPETQSNIPDQNEAKQVAVPDAEAVTNALKDAGLPIENIVVLTQETDDNNLMGRPGGYTSKTFFADGRHIGAGMNPDEQNTVEVFPSEDEATKRREYIEQVTEGVPMFTSYMVQSGPIVLRLDRALEPDEAKAYEDALAGL